MMRKGYWHTLEAIMSGVVIILFLVAIMPRNVVTDSGPNEMIMQGFEELRSLEKKGILRDYVAAGDTDGINSQIRTMRFNHSVSICDSAGVCSGSSPSADNVWVATYFLAGRGNYSPYEVILYLW